MEVASCIAAGLCDKEIAAALHMRRTSVHTYVADLYPALDVHTRAEFLRALRAAHAAYLSESPPEPLPPLGCRLFSRSP